MVNSATINSLLDQIRVRVGQIPGVSRLHGFDIMPVDTKQAQVTSAVLKVLLYVKVLTNAEKISLIADVINIIDIEGVSGGGFGFNIDQFNFKNVPDLAGLYRIDTIITERIA